MDLHHSQKSVEIAETAQEQRSFANNGFTRPFLADLVADFEQTSVKDELESTYATSTSQRLTAEDLKAFPSFGSTQSTSALAINCSATTSSGFSELASRLPNERAASPYARSVQPIDIHRLSPSTPKTQPQSSIPLSPALQFLATMNSPSQRTIATASTQQWTASSPLLSFAEEIQHVEQIGPYTLGPIIARGGFSTIRKATSPNGVVAVKILDKPSTLNQHFPPDPNMPTELALLTEIQIWSSLHHEHILPLFSTHHTPYHTYLVTLYCPAGSLLDVLQHHGSPGLPEDDVGTMFRQIVRGLKYLHEEIRLVHGDVKLENVLVDEMGACRITDFGLAKYRSSTNASNATSRAVSKSRERGPIRRSNSPAPVDPQSSLPPHLRGRRTGRRHTHAQGNTSQYSRIASTLPPGSLPYASPELLRPKNRNGATPDPAQDIWALGCVLHALLYGQLPFMDGYEPRLVDKILRGIWEKPASSPPSSRSRSRSRLRSGAGGRGQTEARSTSSHVWGRPAERLHQLTAGRKEEQSSSRSKSRLRGEGRSTKIGQGAKRVLRGCLVVDPDSRWTISQIDDVAWNLGWCENDLNENEIINDSASSALTTASPQPSLADQHTEHPDEAIMESESMSVGRSDPTSTSAIVDDDEPPSSWVRVYDDENNRRTNRHSALGIQLSVPSSYGPSKAPSDYADEEEKEPPTPDDHQAPAVTESVKDGKSPPSGRVSDVTGSFVRRKFGSFGPLDGW